MTKTKQKPHFTNDADKTKAVKAHLANWPNIDKDAEKASKEGKDTSALAKLLHGDTYSPEAIKEARKELKGVGDPAFIASTNRLLDALEGPTLEQAKAEAQQVETPVVEGVEAKPVAKGKKA